MMNVVVVVRSFTFKEEIENMNTKKSECIKKLNNEKGKVKQSGLLVLVFFIPIFLAIFRLDCVFVHSRRAPVFFPTTIYANLSFVHNVVHLSFE